MRRAMAFLVVLSAVTWVSPAWADTASPWGINAHVPDDRMLDLARDAHIGWIRVDMNWFQMEPGRDRYNWGFMDNVVNHARARGLEIFATLAYTPGWANGTGNIADPPTNTADWYDFVYDTVRRYRGSVKYWGMWNEPNLDQFFTGNGWQYREWILKVGYQAAKAADPSCFVLAPDLAHLSSTNWWDFMEEVMKAGGAAHVDIVTHHCYKGDTGDQLFDYLDRRSVALWENPTLMNVLHDLGVDNKPVWLTEVGWHTDEVSEGEQADNYHQLLWGVHERAWLHKVFPYELKDDPTAGVPPWGIVRADYSTKPAYATYRDFIANPTEPDGGGPSCIRAEPTGTPYAGLPALLVLLAPGFVISLLRRRNEEHASRATHQPSGRREK